MVWVQIQMGLICLNLQIGLEIYIPLAFRLARLAKKRMKRRSMSFDAINALTGARSTSNMVYIATLLAGESGLFRTRIV